MRALVECDIGSAGRGWVVFFLLPVLWIVDMVLLGLVYALVRRASARRVGRPVVVRAAGCLVALLAMALVTWAAVAGVMPENYPEIVCPGNVPRWWPDWLPI